MTQFDLIIIGAGPGGYETAAEAAAMGQKVLVVEKGLLGGTCLNRGCIPTKCLCAAAEAIENIKRASTFGVEASYTATYAAAHHRAEEVVAELRQGVSDILRDVTVIEGEAILAANRVVKVGLEEYAAPKIIIATGSAPAALRGVEGAENAMTSDDFLRLNELPESLTIIGGGVIGLEFACIAHAFGTKVTVIEFCKEILPGFDAEIAKRLRTSLTRKGIDIICDAAAQEITPDGDVLYIRKGKEATVSANMVLAAVGRRAVLPQGIEEAGIELTPRGYISVDPETFETSTPGIYAIGDVNGQCMLAHAASAQGKRVLGIDINLAVVPSVVFTTPEVAGVHKTCENAITHKIPYSANGKALASAQEGLLKVEMDAESKALTACYAIGAHAADLVAEATLAISNGLTIKDIKSTIHAHPTLSELLSQVVSL